MEGVGARGGDGKARYRLTLNGRQHFVTGFNPNTRRTWSNNFLNGETTHTAGCDSHHCWTLEMVGVGDRITFPSHSVWPTIPGQATDGGDEGRGVFEGCFFEDIEEIAAAEHENQLFSASDPNAASCESAFGRACQPNGYSGSGTFDSSDTGFFDDFAGLTIAPAAAATDASWTPHRPVVLLE